MVKIHDWLLDRCSVYYQMWLWVFGKSIHNTLRDECCPDFSCCSNVKKDPFYKRLLYTIKYLFWSLCYNICAGIENLSYKNNERKKMEVVIMDLENTVKIMCSEDFKERFKAEYYQLKIRRSGLKNMLDKWKNGTLEFEPKCPFHLLQKQLLVMDEYLEVLEERAKYEDIKLHCDHLVRDLSRDI